MDAVFDGNLKVFMAVGALDVLHRYGLSAADLAQAVLVGGNGPLDLAWEHAANVRRDRKDTLTGFLNHELLLRHPAVHSGLVAAFRTGSTFEPVVVVVASQSTVSQRKES